MSLAVAALPAGAGAAWLAASREFMPYQTAPPLVAVLVGWAFIGSGLATFGARPGNRLGKVMVFTGFAWFASFLTDAEAPLLFTVGTALQSVYLVGFGYLVLSFPSGRLQGVLDRLLVGCAIALVTVVQLASLLFADSHSVCSHCPANTLGFARDDDLANVLTQVQRVGGVALALVALGLVTARWWRASALQRRHVAPVVWVGGVTLAAEAVSVANDALGDPLGQVPKHVLFVALAAVPVAVMLVLVRRRLAHSAIAGLVVELGGRDVTTDLRHALARALGDPSLQLAYWFPGSARFVDREGKAMALPHGDEIRQMTVIERDGQPMAALVHDAALEENHELIDSVCAAAALTLENERLEAELRARLSELQSSRARLVEATERERRRIERDLHDGAQQRLVALSLALGLLETRLRADPEAAKPIAREAREAVALALDELRELSQGIYPSALTERGVPAALEELRDRAGLPVHLDVSIDVRLPVQVETAAYFAASEAITNAVKHSHASEVRIRASSDRRLLTIEIADDGIGGAAAADGSGLLGMCDRVEALGGRLTLSSPLGRGTTVRAEIPCE